MHTKAYTSARLGQRVFRSPSPYATVPAHEPHPLPLPHLKHLQSRLIRLVRNPLFLVVVTWLMMAALLMVEIVGGQ